MRILLLLLSLLFQGTALASLTQNEAELRRKQVKTVSYNINLEFKKINTAFEGRTSLDLELNDSSTPLRIDLNVKEVKKVRLDGAELKDIKVEKDYLLLPAKFLKKNLIVEIEYLAHRDSGAMLSHVDPDGSEYFYTSLEPIGAHSIFPCLDQPDIKATYNLTVVAPTDWKIIANELSESLKAEKGLTTHKFKKTLPFSTYLFFIGGGDFEEWTDQHKGLPLFLYARKSLAKYIDHAEIFRVTKIGLDYFSDYFNYPMPFSKYGQLFVPNFGSMGMENPGAVTLNERYVFKSKPTAALKIKRSDLIYHELAHMWFGDLVTMKWWDDLWLNEAFASYFATLSLKEALGITSDMYVQALKNVAYTEDLYSTTHPVYSAVPDTLSAFASFDEITYSKGASILKQLHHLLGDEVFKQGLQHYFKTYSFKNTLFTDFLSSFEKFFGKQLDAWASSWLKEKGMNIISHSFSCEKGQIQSFTIDMKPSSANSFYPHKAKFGFYKISDNKVSRYHLADLSFQKASTDFPEMIGTSCPDFIYPNEGGFDYGIYKLDEISIKHAKAILVHHPDPLSRVMMWYTLWMSLREGELSSDQFLLISTEAFKVEENSEVISIVTGFYGMKSLAAFRDGFKTYSTSETRKKYSQILESIILNRLANYPKDHVMRKVFYDLFSLVVQTDLGQKRIIEYLSRAKKGTSEFDQDTRWILLISLSRNGHPSSFALANKELNLDPSESGKRYWEVLKAAFPDLKSKEEAWDKSLNFHKLDFVSAYDLSEFIHDPDRPDLSKPFMPQFFTFLENNDWKRNNFLIPHLFNRFYPYYVCSPEILKMSEDALKRAKNLSPKAKKRWTQAHEDMVFCVNQKQ